MADRLDEYMTGTKLDEVLAEVAAERAHQDEKWGGPEHDDEHTLADWRQYLRERVSDLHTPYDTAARRVLVQTAALAVAAIQSIDRKVATPRAAEGSKDNG